MADHPTESFEQLLALFHEQVDMPEETAPEVAARIVEQEAAMQWLRDRWGEHYPCPNCGNTEWWVSGLIQIAPTFSALVVTCRFCGNVNLVNPYSADLSNPVEAPGDK